MGARKIMIIRHAEKPGTDGLVAGVNVSGSPDPEELVVRGWQRAGALVGFFAPAAPGPVSAATICRPDAILASGIAPHSKSLRPQHTVEPLAQFLNLPLTLTYRKGDEQALVSHALSQSGVILIAWEHKAIPGIANQILGDTHTCPQQWPNDRFDLVWLFDQQPGGWCFSQAPQLLLPGDKPDLIPR